MTKEDLKTLRKQLPRATRYNEINKILKKSIDKEYADGTIKHVLLGLQNNDDIILAAVEVAKAHQKKLKSAIKSIKE